MRKFKLTKRKRKVQKGGMKWLSAAPEDYQRLKNILINNGFDLNRPFDSKSLKKILIKFHPDKGVDERENFEFVNEFITFLKTDLIKLNLGNLEENTYNTVIDRVEYIQQNSLIQQEVIEIPPFLNIDLYNVTEYAKPIQTIFDLIKNARDFYRYYNNKDKFDLVNQFIDLIERNPILFAETALPLDANQQNITHFFNVARNISEAQNNPDEQRARREMQKVVPEPAEAAEPAAEADAARPLTDEEIKAVKRREKAEAAERREREVLMKAQREKEDASGKRLEKLKEEDKLEKRKKIVDYLQYVYRTLMYPIRIMPSKLNKDSFLNEIIINANFYYRSKGMVNEIFTINNFISYMDELFDPLEKNWRRLDGIKNMFMWIEEFIISNDVNIARIDRDNNISGGKQSKKYKKTHRKKHLKKYRKTHRK